VTIFKTSFTAREQLAEVDVQTTQASVPESLKDKQALVALSGTTACIVTDAALPLEFEYSLQELFSGNMLLANNPDAIF
jgi:hypothetical protein